MTTPLLKLTHKQKGRNYVLGFEDGEHVMLGRRETNLPFSRETSRYHATIFRQGDDFYLLDHSLNGTFADPAGRLDPEGLPTTRCETTLFHTVMNFEDNTPSVVQQVPPRKPIATGVHFDRSTDSNYFLDVAVLKESLTDAKRRNDWIKDGKATKLTPGMVIAFGNRNDVYIVRALAEPQSGAV